MRYLHKYLRTSPNPVYAQRILSDELMLFALRPRSAEFGARSREFEFQAIREKPRNAALGIAEVRVPRFTRQIFR
jgi:hypothetical protein